LKLLVLCFGTALALWCGAMTQARIMVRGATLALTRRTTMRKAFLGVWHPMVDQCWLYSLAEAQRRTGVAIHGATRVPNHHHVDGTPTDANFPEFIALAHHDISCSVNTLLAHEGYDQPHELFDDRQTHLLRLMDADAQAVHLVYGRVNCVAAGLVDKPDQVPGRTIGFADWKVGYIDVPRPDVYFGKNRPEVSRLYLSPPPLLYRAYDGDMERMVRQLERMERAAIEDILKARKRPALGAEQLMQLHPWSEPKTLREAGGQRVPTFKIGIGGAVGREVRRAAATEVHEFRKEHEEARLARKGGDYERAFPYGTYNMRVHHNAPVAVVAPGAFVAQPGPTLEEVKQELQEQRERRERWRRQQAQASAQQEVAAGEAVEPASIDGAGEVASRAEVEEPPPGRQDMLERTRELADRVKATFAEEAEVVCEDAAYVPAEMATADEGANRGASSASDPDAKGRDKASTRGPVVVRHRFDRLEGDAEVHGARRLVIHRDRRKGRPPGAATRHGADPPE